MIFAIPYDESPQYRVSMSFSDEKLGILELKRVFLEIFWGENRFKRDKRESELGGGGDVSVGRWI